MRRLFAYLVVPVLGAAVLLTSCQTSDQKRAAVAPPNQAQAPTLTQPAALPMATTPAQTKAGERPSVKPDPVADLVAAAETDYQAGRANYSAGHLEAAKSDFNRAFDTLLRGQFDIRSDDRLQHEFDKIVEGVHQLEMLALKQGDGFSEQQAEPAPIDEANEITFPVDPNVKAKAAAELKTTQSDLPLALNDAVAAYINYFSTRGRGFLERGYVRSGLYRQMILKTLKKEGVPQDLIYLAQAESGFHPLALSHAGARGMWQFMAGRGEQYGLKRDWWVDDRQDPVKSTLAAARHLKDLYNEFGDWYLAMAAYNSGPGTVQRAVERTGYADYWQLYRRGVLPEETRNYVPIILAITIMSKNPSQYGLDRLRPDTPLPTDTVTVDYPLDLRLAAECADTSVAMLQELNPSLLRLTTPKDQPFELRLPAGTKKIFQQAIAAIPQDKRVWWRYHRVSSGETLASIARKYHTTARTIADVNNLEGEELRTERKLIIPITPGQYGSETSFAKRATRYRVRRGDTVLSVADRFSVPVVKLRQWNRLKGNHLPAGRVLIIHRRVAAADERSETASRRRPTRSEEARSDLRAGYKSKRHSKLARQEERHRIASKSAAKRSSRGEERQVVHKVRKGETLTSIASNYNVSVTELRRNNHHVASSLRPGEVLVIKRGD